MSWCGTCNDIQKVWDSVEGMTFSPTEVRDAAFELACRMKNSGQIEHWDQFPFLELLDILGEQKRDRF